MMDSDVLPGWLRRATRHTYADPQAVGWVAWYEWLGATVAFEALDGMIVHDWDQEDLGDVTA